MCIRRETLSVYACVVVFCDISVWQVTLTMGPPSAGSRSPHFQTRASNVARQDCWRNSAVNCQHHGIYFTAKMCCEWWITFSHKILGRWMDSQPISNIKISFDREQIFELILSCAVFAKFTETPEYDILNVGLSSGLDLDILIFDWKRN